MHHPLLCVGHSKHLSPWLAHPLQCHMPVSQCTRASSDAILTKQQCSISSFVLIFVEIPLLLRICPTSPQFDAFIRRFETNYMRAGIYFVMSVIQWISISVGTSSLIAAAVFLLVAAVFYALAGVKGQAFTGSKTLGGQGVAQMIV